MSQEWRPPRKAPLTGDPPYNPAPVPTLSFSHLKKSYAATLAVDDLTFEVRGGEVFGLLGPNGAGKTTLLRLLMGILIADSGEIFLDGRRLERRDGDRIGYLPEERGLYRKEKVREVLIYFGMLKGLARRTARARAEEWLGLLHDPDILVLDEPFSGLDPLNTVLIKDLLRDMSRAGRLVILSTHQMPMVEALCDRVAMIDRGRLVLYGELEEIRRGQGGTLEEIFVRTARAAGAGTVAAGAATGAGAGAGPGAA